MNSHKKLINKWSFDKAQVEVLKYKTIKELRLKNNSLYDWIIRNKLKYELLNHIIPLRKKWTEKLVLENLLNHKTLTSFFSKNSGAYSFCKKNNLLEKLKDIKKSPYLKLTYLDLKLEALKYKNRFDFQKYSSNHYQKAKREKVLEEICSHMNTNLIFWDFNKVKKEALKYTSKKEWETKSPGSYTWARKRNIINDFCSHIKVDRGSSSYETELRNFLKTKYQNCYKKLFKNIRVLNKSYIHRFEIDIYFDDLKKGIEFDGDFFHSFKLLKKSRKNWPDEDIRNYHKIKDLYFESIGIKILHIKESDWLIDKNKCILKCLNFLENK